MLKSILHLLFYSFVSCNVTQNETAQPLLSDPTFPKVELDVLYQRFDPLVQETSGLMKIGDTFWTHNDSGGEAALYQFDMETGDVVRTVDILNVKNNDWEEITRDDEHFYIGNFGNNFGNRKQLVIFKGRIDDLLHKDEVEVENIFFEYPDQEKYYNGYNHNHDAEAMIVYDGMIHLFSKNWLDKKCKQFSIPTQPGSYRATLVSLWDTQGTITGATISDDQDVIMLLGYEPGNGFDPFVWKLQNWENGDLFSGENRRYDFKIRRQMEGIMFVDDRTVLISAEDEDGQYPSLYRMNI